MSTFQSNNRVSGCSHERLEVVVVVCKVVVLQVQVVRGIVVDFLVVEAPEVVEDADGTAVTVVRGAGLWILQLSGLLGRPVLIQQVITAILPRPVGSYRFSLQKNKKSFRIV